MGKIAQLRNHRFNWIDIYNTMKMCNKYLLKKNN